MIHVLNKKDMKISLKAPKAVFFEWNRNTLEIGGVETDNMEKAYADFDGRQAKIIVELLNKKDLTPEIVQEVHMLVMGLRWRIPKNDEVFNRLKEELDLRNLPFKIVVKGTTEEVEKEALDHLYSAPTFKESLRFILPALSVYKNNTINEERMLNNYRNSYLHENPTQLFLLGDVPVIESDPNSPDLLGNFTFALNPTNVFICSDSGRKKVTSSLFYLTQNLATFHLAEQYVACKERKFLEAMIQVYEQVVRDKRENMIMQTIFRYI